MIMLYCKHCGKEFIISESERIYYLNKNLNIPTHCKDCRHKKKYEAYTHNCTECNKTIIIDGLLKEKLIKKYEHEYAKNIKCKKCLNYDNN